VLYSAKSAALTGAVTRLPTVRVGPARGMKAHAWPASSATAAAAAPNPSRAMPSRCAPAQARCMQSVSHSPEEPHVCTEAPCSLVGG
jgi:hypothetical protein